MTIHKGTTLSVVNQGGEPHTFTEVSQFGGGFIEPLNHGEATVPECADGFHNVAVARTRILQGSRLDVTGLQGATGSTIGPGGALYVTEGAAGRISRVDPQTGEITTFASGLPKMIPAVGVGGAITSRSSARPRTYWSPSSALTSAAAT